MAKEKKIGINFFLNKRVKPNIINGENRYPVYARITFDRKNHQCPFPLSYLDGNLTEEEFNDFIALRKNANINAQVQAFKAKVDEVIRAEHEILGKKFKFKGFSERMSYYEKPLLEVLEKRTIKALIEELALTLNKKEIEQINNEIFNVWDIAKLANENYPTAFKKVTSNSTISIQLKSYAYLAGFLSKEDFTNLEVIGWFNTDLSTRFKDFLLQNAPIESNEQKKALGFYASESPNSPVWNLFLMFNVNSLDISLIIKSISNTLLSG